MRVLCAGECMLELSHMTERTLQLGFAGDTYNTAVYLRRVASALGVPAEVGYVTGLGEDPYSEAMRAAWAQEGIADRSLTVPGRVPGLYAIHTTPEGERSFTYWRGESAARAAFADPAVWDTLDGELVHLSGITLQLTPPAARDALLARLAAVRAGGCRVSFDTNYRPAGWRSSAEAGEAMAAVCAVADIVLAGRDDQEALHAPEAPAAALSRLVALGPAEVVLRAGPDGAYVAAGGAVEHVPAARVEAVVDTTAAGDASAGAYLAARLAGRSPRDAAALANAVAGVVIRHRGALVAPEVALLP